MLPHKFWHPSSVPVSSSYPEQIPNGINSKQKSKYIKKTALVAGPAEFFLSGVILRRFSRRSPNFQKGFVCFWPLAFSPQSWSSRLSWLPKVMPATLIGNNERRKPEKRIQFSSFRAIAEYCEYYQILVTCGSELAIVILGWHRTSPMSSIEGRWGAINRREPISCLAATSHTVRARHCHVPSVYGMLVNLKSFYSKVLQAYSIYWGFYHKGQLIRRKN